jgi:bacillolysin
MKSLKNYAVFTLFLLAISLNAQEKSKFLRDDNKEVKELTKKVSDNGWLEFKEGNKTKHTDFFIKHKDAFGLGAKDKMEVTREDREAKTNYKHYRMQQSYGGIPIEGAEFFLHYNAKDELDVANGKLCENLTISSTPKITADKALTSALKEFKNVVFLWQDTARENSLKRESGNILATYKPKGELVITFPDNEELKSSKAVLAYVFNVSTSLPIESWKFYIDAQSGNIIKKRNNEVNCDHPRTLTFVSLYNGNQSTSSCRRNYGFLGLGGIGNFLGTDQWDLNFSIRDFNTKCEIQRNWEDWGTTDQQFTTANWALENAWVYFRDVHGRNGWNGNGKQARLFVKPDGNILPSLARYIGGDVQEMEFGQMTMSLDITAHEFTHGVVDFSAKLNGTAISKSLNESFADIFGEMSERRVTGITNWRIGNQVPWTSIGLPTFFRDLLNPASSSTPQPSVFEGANWDFSNNIQSPHRNGGVQNRWFSLLALGGTQLGTTVQGIGADAAANIAFYNLTHFLGANSNYQDARDGAINSARILYGCGSNELLQTWRAWNAVGLATPMPAPSIPTNLIYQCEIDQTASITPCWFQGATYNWSNIASVGGVVSGNTLTFNIQTVKAKTVTLTATFQGTTFSIPIFIKVYSCSGNPLLRTPKVSNNGIVFSISPNPTSEKVNVDLKDINDEGVYKVSIVNSVGQVMKNETLIQYQNQISLSGLANGLYNIIIYDSAGVIKQSSKIIKSPY